MRQWQQIKRKAEKEMDRGHSRLDRFGHQHSSEAYRRQTQMASCCAHRQPSGRTALDDDDELLRCGVAIGKILGNPCFTYRATCVDYDCTTTKISVRVCVIEVCDIERWAVVKLLFSS